MPNKHLEKMEALEAATVKPVATETHEQQGDTWSISIPKTRICTLEQLIEHCKIDLAVWDVTRVQFNKWEVGANLGHGKIEVEPLFQVKAICVRRKDILAVKNEIADLKAEAKKSAIVIKRPRYEPAEDNMLEISLPDMHFGKLAWATETSWENYDLKIAEECYTKALSALLNRTSHHTYKQVCFVVGNDLLHSDNPQGTTTKGTRVSCDGRFQKTFQLVRNLMIASIDQLQEIAPVKVVMVPGNHDNQSLWHLGDSLECWFHKASHIQIDNEPRQRKYLRWGRVMLMFTHGDKGKREDYPLVMATEEPEMFGQTFWREAQTGHLHHKTLIEKHGVLVRQITALCAADDWHSENNFVGNIRSAEALVYSGQEGLISSATYSLPVTSANRVKGHTK